MKESLRMDDSNTVDDGLIDAADCLMLQSAEVI